MYKIIQIKSMNLKNVIHYPDNPNDKKYSDFFETYKMTFIIAEYPEDLEFRNEKDSYS
jgi:hypothetical protein